ncbi:olfactory receptor 11A1-like [Gastrophryne carolinensis]
MCKDNETEITEFLLLGFRALHELKFLLFAAFLFVFIVIVNGNLLIVFLVATRDRLRIPMFIFLQHLATADILLTTTVMPLMLEIILLNRRSISVRGCLAQMFFIFIFGFVQCFFIALMSYDRCLAICTPMRYALIMRPDVVLWLVGGSWFLVFAISGEMILVYQLHFCGLNTIDHFFCDFSPTVALATSETSVLLQIDLVISVFMILLPFAFTVLTYVAISFTILGISSNSGRSKAFSTCSSHLATVCAYYGTLMNLTLTSANQKSITLNKFSSLLYIVVTPLLNPIIYSLRNHEIRKTLQTIIRDFRVLY